MLDSLNASYMGDMTERYICFPADIIYEDFREKMLIYNNIGGHLRMSIIYDDNEKIYRYNISGRKSLREVLKEQHMSDLLLKHLLMELERIFIRGKSYMLEEENYVIHPDGMFFSPEGQMGVCYLPGYGKPIHEQLCALLGYMMDCVDVNDKQSVYAVYSSIVLVREGNCTFGSLIELLQKSKEAQNNTDNSMSKVEGVAEEESVANALGSKNGKMLKEKLFVSNAFKRKMGYIVAALTFLAVVIYFIGM